ncbi:hypothetical protein CBR_g21862 [Chara braunii]|uniref:Uncharacterized protein n=1 Tax=Chara braunii TaxID=69332 RepID=A0A388L1N5_CHABU|nr:hypothetical protein CBR_g21862 [Chara braunii]|eukprot:GBG76113.1 hypothetical protein CBR_g21862 [Chara braunii]
MIDRDEGDVEERASGKRTLGMRSGQEQGVKKRQSKQEGATTSKKPKRPDGLIICEGEAMGEGDSVRLGIAATREPSEKSKRKLAAEEGDGQKKPWRRKTAEGTSGGERAIGRQYDEAATFWLEYERNDDGEIVENELPIQLLIDPRKVSLTENTKHKMSKQRTQKAAFEDIREAWENQGRPVAIQGNPSGKETEKQTFFDFQKLLLGKSPNGGHWTMTPKATTLADKDHLAPIGNALRQWMPLVTAGDKVFRKGMKFYDKWAKEKLLGGDRKTPLSNSGKYMPDKSLGLQAIPEMGVKGAAGETKMGWLVRVPTPPTIKKMQLDDNFFVVVKESDMFCWQSLADMTDAEKLSILDDILPLRGVFVQSAGRYLKRQHNPGIKDMVETRKVNRMMLRMFHYVLFLEYEEDAEVWRYGSQFFRTEEQLLVEFAPRGLTNQVWVELWKHFQGVVEYVNTCTRCLPYEESLDETKKMYDDERFSKSFEKSVRSILRRTEEEVQDTIRVSGDVRHIK